MYYLGNENLLEDNPIALYCSREIPLSIYQSSLKFVSLLMSKPITLAGGWHSALEKEAIKTRQPSSSSNIIYFIAKGIQDFNIPYSLRTDLDTGKLLLVSPYLSGKRIDKKKVAERDELMLSKINKVLFLNIDEGGNLNKLFEKCLSSGKEIFIFNHFTNLMWATNDVCLISEKNLEELL